MKIKILKYILVAITFLVAFLAWFSIDRAVNVDDSSTWVGPMLWFSLLFIFLYLDIILIKRIVVIQSVLVIIFLSSFAFANSLWHFVAIAIAYLFSFWALLKIKKDLRLNVKIDLWKSIRTGSTMLLIAVSTMIVSQYYFEVKNLDSQQLIPQFKINSMTGSLTSKILSSINPELKSLDDEGLTVDQFILQIQNKEQSEAGGEMDSRIKQMIEQSNPGITSKEKSLLKEEVLKEMSDTGNEITKGQNDLLLQEARKKFSEIAGKNLKGDEKVSDILSEVVNRKINQYLGSGLADSEKSSPLPYIMAIGLFLTVLPMGSFINTFWILLVEIIFLVFKKTGLVYIDKVPVEMEVIE